MSKAYVVDNSLARIAAQGLVLNKINISKLLIIFKLYLITVLLQDGRPRVVISEDSSPEVPRELQVGNFLS